MHIVLRLQKKKVTQQDSEAYVGNGNADGTFVYTGFKPSFCNYVKELILELVIGFCIMDDKRDVDNPDVQQFIAPNNK